MSDGPGTILFFFLSKPYVRQTPRRMGISFFIFLVASTLEEINFSPSPWLAMQSYKISLHRLKTSVDGWSIVRNHREFLSCCIAVTSFSFTRMKIDNSKRKGVLEISSSLFPIRKRLRLIPPLQPIFISSTNCSNPRSGSDSRKLPCSAKHFSICPTPAEVNEVDANAPSGSQASQLPPNWHLPACGPRRTEGVPRSPPRSLSAPSHHLRGRKTWLERLPSPRTLIQA